MPYGTLGTEREGGSEGSRDCDWSNRALGEARSTTGDHRERRPRSEGLWFTSGPLHLGPGPCPLHLGPGPCPLHLGPGPCPLRLGPGPCPLRLGPGPGRLAEGLQGRGCCAAEWARTAGGLLRLMGDFTLPGQPSSWD